MSNETYVRFIVEDGSQELVPDILAANKISVPKDMDSIVSFDVFSESGVPIDISAHTVTISVRKRPTDTVSLAKITAVTSQPSPSCYGQFIFPKTLWSLASAGLYVYDIVAVDGIGNSTQISKVRQFQIGY